jgi:hypothetical protein
MMAKQSHKSRQAAGLRRASHRRNISSQQAARMQDRADRLMREVKRDKERIEAFKARQVRGL